MKKWHRNRENMKKEYKVQAVKLAKEIVAGKAAKELAVLRKQNKALEREIRRLKVRWQRFYQYLSRRESPWQYQGLAEAMWEIHDEDVCNDTYGRRRMYQVLPLKQPEGIPIPSESTVYRVMKEIGMVHHPKRRPNSITKANREARKSDDLLKRDFAAEKPLEKCVTDITEVKAKDGKLWV